MIFRPHLRSNHSEATHRKTCEHFSKKNFLYLLFAFFSQGPAPRSTKQTRLVFSVSAVFLYLNAFTYVDLDTLEVGWWWWWVVRKGNFAPETGAKHRDVRSRSPRTLQ